MSTQFKKKNQIFEKRIEIHSQKISITSGLLKPHSWHTLSTNTTFFFSFFLQQGQKKLLWVGLANWGPKLCRNSHGSMTCTSFRSVFLTEHSAWRILFAANK
jgi:hypothetical protein